MRVVRATCCLVLLGVAPAGCLVAQAIPDLPSVSGTLAFDGHGTLGDFTGTTSILSGRLVGAATIEGVRGEVEAPVATLRTGNGKRDRDMMSSLEADRFPSMRFDLDRVSTGAAEGDSTAVTLHGRFTIHGVTREAAVTGWVWLHTDQVHFRGQLPMDVRDYRVGGLSKFLGVLKMNPEIMVRVDVAFRR